MDGRDFIKMHGIGNDFVVVDARTAPFAIDAATAKAISDRRTGVGCDQLIVMEPSAKADVFMRIRNSDGGEVETCGNGARCVASMLLAETGKAEVLIDTLAGMLHAEAVQDGWFAVSMGVPRFGWRQIPLAREMDTLHVDLAIGPASRPVLSDPVALSMGNPHAVFLVDDVDEIDIVTVGPMLEHHPLFPERANIGIAQVLAPDRVRLRVWERGAGLTQACGSGACAAAVAAMRRGLTRRQVTMVLDGGELVVGWRESDDMVVMSGPVATSFTGRLAPELFAGRADQAA